MRVGCQEEAKAAASDAQDALQVTEQQRAGGGGGHRAGLSTLPDSKWAKFDIRLELY